VLSSALDDRWNADWLAQYVDLAGIESAQARQAKSWLKSHKEDALVHLLAARAEANAGDWQKASEHAKHSDELAASAAARVELARCEQMLGGSAAESADEKMPDTDTETDASTGEAA